MYVVQTTNGHHSSNSAGVIYAEECAPLTDLVNMQHVWSMGLIAAVRSTVRAGLSLRIPSAARCRPKGPCLRHFT